MDNCYCISLYEMISIDEKPKYFQMNDIISIFHLDNCLVLILKAIDKKKIS